MVFVELLNCGQIDLSNGIHCIYNKAHAPYDFTYTRQDRACIICLIQEQLDNYASEMGTGSEDERLAVLGELVACGLPFG